MALIVIFILLFGYFYVRANWSTPSKQVRKSKPVQKRIDPQEIEEDFEPEIKYRDISSEFCGTLLFQCLESLYIIENSDKIDTLVGRKKALDRIITELQEYYRKPLYKTDFQIILDQYKNVYYDKVPTEAQILLGLQPSIPALNLLYVENLERAMNEHYKTQMFYVDTLKTEKGRYNRRLKLTEELVKYREQFEQYQQGHLVDRVNSLISQLNVVTIR